MVRTLPCSKIKKINEIILRLTYLFKIYFTKLFIYNILKLREHGLLVAIGFNIHSIFQIYLR